MDIKKIESRPELMDAIRGIKEGADRSTKKVLADTDMTFFRGVATWVGFVNGIPVTLNSTHFGKRKSGIWEPYSNYYIAVTRMENRRQGYARELNTYVEELAIKTGCIRVKALDGTRLGVLFTQGLGLDVWGLTDKNDLIVDSPLVFDGRFPESVTPKTAKKWTNRITPLTKEEIEFVLNNVKFRYDE